MEGTALTSAQAVPHGSPSGPRDQRGTCWECGVSRLRNRVAATRICLHEAGTYRPCALAQSIAGVGARRSPHQPHDAVG